MDAYNQAVQEVQGTMAVLRNRNRAAEKSSISRATLRYREVMLSIVSKAGSSGLISHPNQAPACEKAVFDNLPTAPAP